MSKNKIWASIIGALVVGLFVGGAYVNSFGVNLPLRDQGMKSDAAMQGPAGQSAGDPCTYTNANGSVRRGRVVIWEDFGYVCQSSSGWSKNFN